MKQMDTSKNALTWLTVLVLAVVGAGCENKVSTNPTTPTVARPAVPPDSGEVDAKRLNDGTSKLIDAMKMPSESFHFSFKGEENLEGDPELPPDVGTVGLEADVSPQETELKETRGKETKDFKAANGDEVKSSMVHMTIVQAMSNPMLVIAVGASVTSPPTADLVGTITADKFVFDTASVLTPAQRAGMERARIVLSTIQSCRGSAWIAKDSGELVQFNIDAEYRDKYGHEWQEHYEGGVTPR